MRIVGGGAVFERAPAPDGTDDELGFNTVLVAGRGRGAHPGTGASR